MQRFVNNQNRLDLLVALGFSALMLVLSISKIVYINVSPYHTLDMGLIIAIFAAMIGGYKVGLPVAIFWAYLAFENVASELQIFSLSGLIICRVTYVLVAVWGYKMFRRVYEFSPANVYRTIFLALLAKTIVANGILYQELLQINYKMTMNSFLIEGLTLFVLEVALASLAMKLLIKNLRQVHILNGVKRREKARKKAKQAATDRVEIQYMEERG